MKPLAIFPVTGDPFHKGHLEVIRNAQRDGLQVRVLIMEDSNKSPILSLKDRVKAAENFKGLLDEPYEVEVSGESLLGDAIVSMPELPSLIIKGARASDAEFNIEQRELEAHLQDLGGLVPGRVIRTTIPTSSSRIRALAFHHKDITTETSTLVQARLWRTFFQQKVVGVVGASRHPGLYQEFQRAMTAQVNGQYGVYYESEEIQVRGDFLQDLKEDLKFRRVLRGRQGLIFIPIDYRLVHRVNGNVLYLGEPEQEAVNHWLLVFRQHRYGTRFEVKEGEPEVSADLINAFVKTGRI